MEIAKPIGYALAHSVTLGILGFTGGCLAQPLFKTAITRIALGTIGAKVLGGTVAVQYAIRIWIHIGGDSNRAENLYLQAMGVGFYSIISAMFIALDVLSIPLALTPLLYPIFLVFLTCKNQGSSKWEQNLRPINFLPETPFDFVIGREILVSLRTLLSKNK